MQSNWDSEDVATAAQAWASGYSASQVSRMLEGRKSRQAVIGKMTRLGIVQGDKRSLGELLTPQAAKRFPWTDALDDQLVAEFQKDSLSREKLAELVGCTLDQLKVRIATLRQAGRIGAPGSYWSDADIALMRRLHSENVNAGVIAFQLDRSFTAVTAKMRKLGLTPAPYRFAGPGGRSLPAPPPGRKVKFREVLDRYAPEPARDQAGNRYTLETVPDRACRWPDEGTDPGKDGPPLCGLKVKERRDRFCPYHQARGSQGKPKVAVGGSR